MITGMEGFYSFMKKKTKFLSTIELKNTEKKTDDIKKISNSLDRDPPDENDENSFSGVKRFEDLFKQKISEIFLDNEKKYDIKKVNVCFKINKYIELEEKLDKCEEIISSKGSPYQKNKNTGIKQSQRNYYY